MAVTYDQTPGELDLKCVVGNDLDVPLVFGGSLVGYTFTSYIVLEITPALKTFPITVYNEDLAAGLLRLRLTSTQTIELGQISGKAWYFSWNTGTGQIRNILRGKFQLDRF